jgi:hypothetical protein
MITTINVHRPFKDLSFDGFHNFLSIKLGGEGDLNLFITNDELDDAIESAEKIVSKLKERKESL